MKNYTILIVAVFVISCQQKNESEMGQSETKIQDSIAAKADQADAILVAHPMLDDKNQVMGQMTFPTNWQLHNEPGKAAFSGPSDIFVYYIPIHNFMYSNDQMTAQAYAQNGGKLRAPIPAKDVVRQDLAAIAKNEGSKLIRVYDSPEISKSDGSIYDMMYHIGPKNQRNDAVVSEWEDKNGNPYAIILHVTITDMGNLVMWSYYGHGLDAPKDKYEWAKTVLVNGLASLQYNPRYFDRYNQNEQNRESSSWAAHNQKMSAQQRQFDSQQAVFKEKSEAINKSVAANYDNQDVTSDRIHNRFLNYIKDENTVTNTADGKRYQVETGSNQYWINDDGKYIGTNNPNYDPNRNPNTNETEWNETQIDE